MAVEEISRYRVRQLRWLGLGLGAALAVVGLAADRIGLSHSPGFGLLQLLLISLGGFLVLVTLLGRRVLDGYRGLALLGLNTLLLLVGVEFCAMLVLRFMPEPVTTLEAPRAVYYAGQPWSEGFRREYDAAHVKRFHPFVMWRTAPFAGEHINVDHRGIRRTEGSRCVDGAFLVFAFGGSTMWGVGSPDWGTIPSYLTSVLESRFGSPICLINFGEHGWVSTQSVVQLIRELDAGHIPHLVVFYDGINDAYSAVIEREAGIHYEIGVFRGRLEERPPPPALAWLQSRAVYRLATRIREKPAAEPATSLSPKLAQAVVDNYLNNYRIVATLAREYGFDYRLFWQPNLVVHQRELTPEEQRLLGTLDPEEAAFVADVYARMRNALGHGRENLYDLAGLFDRAHEHPYVDWMHLTPDGNRAVAHAIAASFGE